MDRIWLISAALLLSIYCLVFYCYQVSQLWRHKFKAASGIRLILLIKNQEQVVEGLIKTCLFKQCSRPVEIIAVDFGSGDRTDFILNCLAGQYQNLRYLKLQPASRLFQHCSGQTTYCFDLTGPVKYHVIADIMLSILNQKLPMGPRS